MIEPKAVAALADSKVATTVAKQLWSTMLFLVVMSLISLFGTKWLSSSIDPISMIISYWMWFIAMIIITGFGLYAFVLDARIQTTNPSDTQ